MPTTIPLRVSWLCSVARATPKSMTVAPSTVSITLDGFRSRWTMPSSCTGTSPLAASRSSSHTASAGSGPWWSRTASLRVSPGT